MESDIEAQQRAAEFVDSAKATSVELERRRTSASAALTVDAGVASAQKALADMMGDAPLCDVCGHITVRNGACFKCLNCGNSLGCS